MPPIEAQRPEPRSGETYIAWGVSPRFSVSKKNLKPRSGDRWNRLNEMSVAPPGLKSLGRNRDLGLTPQANYLSRLRRSTS